MPFGRPRRRPHGPARSAHAPAEPGPDRGAKPGSTPDRSKLFESHGQRPWLQNVVNLGITLAVQEKLEEAANAFREAIRLMPDLEVAHTNLVIVLCRQGKLDEATAAYREAIRWRPNLAHSGFASVLLDVLARPGEHDKAAELRERCRPQPGAPIPKLQGLGFSDPVMIGD